jgi:hypothetical protein
MALSERAQQMLEQGIRHPCRIERTQILAALQQADLPVFEPIVAFQQRFGGIEYRVKGSSHGMSFNLFQKDASPQERLPEISAFTGESQRYFFECGEHRVAQFGFYLDQEGTLYVDERFSSPVAIASSVEKYIESDAMVNELIDLPFTCWSPLGIVAQGENEFKKRLALLELPVIGEASDQYTTWWGNDRIRVVQAVYWVDRPPQNRIVAYARTHSTAQQFIDTLRDLLLAHLPALQLLPWPMRRNGWG